MQDFWDTVLVCVAVVGTIAIVASLIFLWQYFLFAVLVCGIVCSIIGVCIALYHVVNVLVEVHKRVQ